MKNDQLESDLIKYDGTCKAWFLFAIPITLAHQNIFWPPSTHSCMEFLSKPPFSIISAFSSFSSIINRSDSVYSLLSQSDPFPIDSLLKVASKHHQESSGMKSISFSTFPHRSTRDHLLPAVSLAYTPAAYIRTLLTLVFNAWLFMPLRILLVNFPILLASSIFLYLWFLDVDFKFTCPLDW